MGLAALMPAWNPPSISQGAEPPPVVAQQTIPAAKPLRFKTHREFLTWLQTLQGDLNKMGPTLTSEQLTGFEQRLSLLSPDEAASWLHKTVPDQPGSSYQEKRPIQQRLLEGRQHPFFDMMDVLFANARRTGNQNVQGQVKKYWMATILATGDRRSQDWDRMNMRYLAMARLNEQFGVPQPDGHKEYPFTVEEGLRIAAVDSNNTHHLFEALPVLRQNISQWLVREVQRQGLTQVIARQPENSLTLVPGGKPMRVWDALDEAQQVFRSSIKMENLYREFLPKQRTSTTLLPLMNTAYERVRRDILEGKSEATSEDYTLLELAYRDVYGGSRILRDVFTADAEADRAAHRKANDPAPLMDAVLKMRPAPEKIHNVLQVLLKDNPQVTEAMRVRYMATLVQISDEFLNAFEAKEPEKIRVALLSLRALALDSQVLFTGEEWSKPSAEMKPVLEQWHQQTKKVIALVGAGSKLTEEQAEPLFALLTERDHFSHIEGELLLYMIGSPLLDRSRSEALFLQLGDGFQAAEEPQHRYVENMNRVTRHYIDALKNNQPEEAEAYLNQFENLFTVRRKMQMEAFFSDRNPAARPLIKVWDEQSEEMTGLCLKNLNAKVDAHGLMGLIKSRDELSSVSANGMMEFFLENEILDPDTLDFFNEKLYHAPCSQPENQVKYLGRLNTLLGDASTALKSGKWDAADLAFKRLQLLLPFEKHFQLATLTPESSANASAPLAQWESLQVDILEGLNKTMARESVGASAFQVLTEMQLIRPSHPEQTALNLIDLLNTHRAGKSIPYVLSDALEGLLKLTEIKGQTPPHVEDGRVRLRLAQFLSAALEDYIVKTPANKAEGGSYNTFLNGASWLAASKFGDLSPLNHWQQRQLELLIANPTVDNAKKLVDAYESLFISTSRAASDCDMKVSEKLLIAGRPMMNQLVDKAMTMMASDKPEERQAGGQILALIPEMTPMAYANGFMVGIAREHNAVLRPVLFAYGRDAFGILDRQMAHPGWKELKTSDDLRGRAAILQQALYALSATRANPTAQNKVPQLTANPRMTAWDARGLSDYLKAMQPLLAQSMEKGPEWRQATIQSVDSLVNLFPEVLGRDEEQALAFPLDVRLKTLQPVIQRYLEILEQNPASFNGTEAEALCRLMRWVPEPEIQNQFRQVWAKAAPGDVAVKSQNLPDAIRQVAALRFLPPTMENTQLLKPYLGLERPLAFSREGLGAVVEAWFWQDWMSSPDSTRQAFLYELQQGFLPRSKPATLEKPSEGSTLSPVHDLIFDLMMQAHLGPNYNEIMGRSMGSEASLYTSLAWGEYPPPAYSSALNLEYLDKNVLETLPKGLTIEKIKEAQHKFSVELCKQFSNSKPEEMAEMRRIHASTIPVLRSFTRHRIETLDPRILNTLPDDIRKNLKEALDTMDRNPPKGSSAYDRSIKVIQGLGLHMARLDGEWSSQVLAQARFTLVPLIESFGRFEQAPEQAEGQLPFYTLAEHMLAETRMPQDSVLAWQAYQPDELPLNWTQPNIISDNWRVYGKHRQLKSAYAEPGKLSARPENVMRMDTMILPPWPEYRSMNDLVGVVALKIQMAETAYTQAVKQDAHFKAAMEDLKKELEELFSGERRVSGFTRFINTFLESPALGDRNRKERMELLLQLGISASDVEFYTSDYARSKLKP